MTGDFNQFYPAPMYRSYAINRSRRSNTNVLTTSMVEHLAAMEAEIGGSFLYTCDIPVPMCSDQGDALFR